MAQGGVIQRDAFFDATVVELQEGFPGVVKAVDDFIEALKLGGAELPARDIGGGRYVHVIDDPTAGRLGLGRFAAQYHATPPTTGTGPTHFVLIDIWIRDAELPVIP